MQLVRNGPAGPLSISAGLLGVGGGLACTAAMTVPVIDPAGAAGVVAADMAGCRARRPAACSVS